jgi:hypothetical protein
MTPEMKGKWIDALRSGKYKQTVGGLKDAEGYCCLGVLASINGHEPNIDGLCDIGEEYADTEGLLPEVLADRFGISHDWMDFYAGENDGGHTFLEIADDLETRKPERLSDPL